MPRIQPYEQQVSAQGQIGGRRADASDFAPLAGLEAVVSTVDRLATHYTNLRRDSQLSTTTAKAQQELQEYSFTLQNGNVGEDGVYQAPPDPMQHQQLFTEKVKEINKRVKDSLDDETYALFERDFSGTALRESFKVRENVIGKQRDAVMVEFQSNLTTLADIAANAPDEGGQLRAREDARLMAQKLVAGGVMTAEEGFKAEKSFDTIVTTSQIRHGMRDDPEGTLQALLGKGFPLLTDPAVREKWIDQASRRYDSVLRANIAEEERTRRDQERAQRDLEDTTAKSADEMAVEGKLTPTWVMDNRENLSEGDYRHFLDVSKGKNVVSDPETYVVLRDRAMAGKNVEEEAQLAYLNRKLSREDFDRILSDLKTSGVIKTASDADSGKPRWIKNGEDFIKTSLNAESPQTDSLTRMRAARVVDDWRLWAADHPNASDDEARKAYKGFADDALLLDDRGSTVMLIPPRFIVGTAKDPDVQATATATRRALDAGQIDQWEYRRQLDLIKALSDAQKKRAARPKPSKPSGAP